MRKALKNGFLLGLQSALPMLLGVLPVSCYFAWQDNGNLLGGVGFNSVLFVIPFAFVVTPIIASLQPERTEEQLRKGARLRKGMVFLMIPLVTAIILIESVPPAYGALKYARRAQKSVADQRAAHPDDLVQVPGLAAGSMPLMLSYIPSDSFVTGQWIDRRRVILTHGFWMGRHEVTNAQFEAFVNDTGYVTSVEKEGVAHAWDANKNGYERIAGVCWRNAPFPWLLTGNPKDHPVVFVSWDDAKAFCAWLGAKVGGAWDLPTDAQWEYACRAGTRTAFYWGDSLDEACAYENVATTEMRRSLTAMDHCPREHRPFPCEDGFHATAPVGQFAPNAFGLYDMLGNVSEWCRDKYTSSRSAPLFLAVDPQGPQGRRDSGLRVTRGGCWEEDSKYCRADYSSSRSNNGGSDNLGFRVIRVE